MPATVAGIHLGPDTHANRPAADAAGLPIGALYYCSDHDLVYITDGSTWTTYLDATGSGISATTVDAKGDLLVATADDTVARLAVGTNDYVLTADSAEATGVKWAAASGGMSNPMTTAGDIIYSSDGSGTPARLGVGDDDDVLTLASGVPTWAPPAGGGGGAIAAAYGAYDGTGTTINPEPTAETTVPDITLPTVVVAATSTVVVHYRVHIVKGATDVIRLFAYLDATQLGSGSVTGAPHTVVYDSGNKRQQATAIWVGTGITAGSYPLDITHNAVFGTSSTQFVEQHLLVQVIPE